MDISSAIVHARAGCADRVYARLAAHAGIEVHAQSDDGKLIVTIETANDRASADVYDAIGHMEDVLSVSLVYHQTESDPDMDISVEA